MHRRKGAGERVEAQQVQVRRVERSTENVTCARTVQGMRVGIGGQ